jgi:hypothetical protein
MAGEVVAFVENDGSTRLLSEKTAPLAQDRHRQL